MKRGMIEENEHEQPAATFRTSDQAVAAGNSGEQGARAIVGSEEQHFLKDYGESFIKLLISGKKNLGKKQKEFLEKRLSQSLQNYLEFISDDSRHNHLKRLTSHLCDIYALALMELPTTFRTSDQAVAAGNSGEQGASAIVGSEEQHFLKDYGERVVMLLFSTTNLGKEGEEATKKFVHNYLQICDQSRDDHAQALKSFTDHIIDNYRVNLVSVGEDSVGEGKPRTPFQPEGGPHSSGVYGELYVKLLISTKNLGKEKEQAVEKILSQTVQNYLKFNDQSRYDHAQGLKSLTDFLIDAYSAKLVSINKGSVIIIVECPSLESLERLWADYLDGNLDKVAERYLVTNEMRKELNLETVCLTTTIEEENYLNCKEALMALPETCTGSSIPAEIRLRGARAERAFQKAMQTGRKVKVYRGRVMLLGQDRAGKTSLRKSLLGLPFDPERESTVGVEVDEVEKWMPIERKKGEDNIARFIFRGLRDSETLDNDSTSAHPNVEEGKTTDQLEEKKDHKEPKLSPDGDEPVTSTEEIEVGLKAISEENLVDKNELSNELQLNSNLNFTELAARYSQSRPEDDIKSEEVILSLWDFAGQHLYYASHSVFLSGRAVYILVYNLNKNLLATAEPCVKQGVNDIRLDNPSNETNLDNLLSWLVSIHNIRSSANKNVAHQRRKLPYQRPPVIIVGTNLDQPFEKVATAEMRIRDSIMGKEYTKHVITTFFAVDNSTENDEGVRKLRDKIMEVLKGEPYMPEEVPLRWFNFERAVDALVAKQTYFMDLDQLLSVIRQVCQMEDEEEVTAMLNFYHDLGVIVKHGRTVVLHAQWLIDFFKQLITVPPFNEAIPLYVNCWRELEVNGILREALVDDVFSKLIDKGLCKQDILGMMEQHGLVVRFSIAADENQDEQRYFVPTQLRSSPSKLYEIKPCECDPCPLILHFLDGFVPHGLFPQLVSKFIHWCSENSFKNTPQLFNNGARLFIGKQITFALILICRKRFIKIVLKTMNPSSCKSLSMNASNKMAIKVRNFIERTLDDFSRDFSWLSNLRCELSVVCTHCQQRECDLDGLMSCCHDDRLHLLRVRRGEELICMENFSDETVKVPGWEMWFEEPDTQTMEPEEDTRIADDLDESVSFKPGTVAVDDVILIAFELGSLWKRIGLVLKVPRAVISHIEADKSEVFEKCHTVLTSWRERFPHDATYHCLARALKHPAVGRDDLAVKYCGLQFGKDVPMAKDY